MKKEDKNLTNNLEALGVDIEDIRISLVDASMSGLFRFIEENMMEKTVDVVHDFRKLNDNVDSNLLPVRITFQPLSDEEKDHWIAVTENKIH
tara:strand:- start:158 stop:433 length:276 start_codon:yes stop_codon:yes gene_type:complete